MRVATTLVIASFAAATLHFSALAQSPPNRTVALEVQSASRALDAVPAVFAVAENLEGVGIDVSADSMADGFSGLADEAAAQDQLAAALGAYGFEGYGDWAATIKTIFATYGFVLSVGQTAPAVDRALQQVLNDPGVPNNQKDAIANRFARLEGSGLPGGATPTEENLAVVIGLLPHIVSTMEMMRAMQ